MWGRVSDPSCRVEDPALHSCPERHPEMLQQHPPLVVRSRGRHDRDIHSFQLVDLRVINLREDQLIMQPEGVITPSVKRLDGDSAKVTYTRKNDANQTVEKFIHSIATQRDHRTDRHTFAYFESRNRLSCPRHNWFLSGNLSQFVDGRIENLCVLRRLAHTHVDDNLVQPGNRSRVLEVEFFHQRGGQFFFKPYPQPRTLF